jgi:glycosyltransferase involved in cell wall biosynthesis
MINSQMLFCSVIIPTIGRDTLPRAVQSVLDQAFDPACFEVIVVNDSGGPLPAAPCLELASVRLLHNNRRERSFARNSGAAAARGTYLYFLDDDDWLLPGALAAFWQLAQEAPEAAWLHGGMQIVDDNGHILAAVHSGVQDHCLAQVMGGAWVPIQSSLVRAREFFAVGGYNLLLSSTEDQDLCRRIAQIGTLAATETAVACLYRGANWQTSTDYDLATHSTRLSRDHVADQTGVFRQMLASAADSYWYGRVVHIYLALALWHIRQRHLFTALSRGLHGLLALLCAGSRLRQSSFWQGLGDDHVPGSLHFIQIAWEQEAQKKQAHG